MKSKREPKRTAIAFRNEKAVIRHKVSGAIAVSQASWGCAPALPNRIQGGSLEIGFMKITFLSIRKTHTGTTLSVCVFLFAIFLKNYLTNRKTYAIIKVLCEFFTVRGVTQLGRVLALGARCRRFESCRLDHIVPNILSNHRQDVFLCCNSLTKITLSFLFSAESYENFF